MRVNPVRNSSGALNPAGISKIQPRCRAAGHYFKRGKGGVSFYETYERTDHPPPRSLYEYYPYS